MGVRPCFICHYNCKFELMTQFAFSLALLLTTAINIRAQVFKTQNILLEKSSLEYGFELIGAVDTTEVLSVYEQLLVKHNNIPLFFDTATYFFFENPNYPMLLKTGTNSFELLLETDGRPQVNGLLHLQIRNDTVIRADRLPIFITKAVNLDTDPALEYAGSIGYPEASETYLPYSPIVYYELHPDGIRIDSVLTQQRNAIIYGKFHGFEYREDLHQPLNRMAFYNGEIERIKNAK